MILIKNAYIKPMVGEDIANGAILLGDDGKIAAIGADIEAPAGATVIDAEGKVLYSGVGYDDEIAKQVEQNIEEALR